MWRFHKIVSCWTLNLQAVIFIKNSVCLNSFYSDIYPERLAKVDQIDKIEFEIILKHQITQFELLLQ